MKKYWVVLILAVMLSCQKQPETQIEDSPGVTLPDKTIQLDKEIIKYPPSLLSARDELRFQFREPLIPRHFVNNTLDKNPLTFEPDIKGDAIWKSRTVLIFVPAGPMPAGKTVSGVLHGKVAFGDQLDVDDFEFSFKIAEQELLDFSGDFNAVTGERNMASFTGKLAFSQSVDIKKLRKDFKIDGPDGRLDYELTANSDNTVFEIKSAPVAREGKGKDFKFSLPGAYRADEKSWQDHIPLPGIDEFKVLANMDMSEEDADDLTYGFRFNEPIKSGLDVSGFVSITPEIEFSMKTEGKYLLVSGPFLPGRQYRMVINEGFPSEYGTRLKENYVQSFSLDNIKPEIDWLSEGVYLPTSNEYKIQFKSVNISKVHIRVMEIFPQNVGFFIQENMLQDRSESWRNERYYGYNNSFRDLERVAEFIHKQDLYITSERNKWINTELDLSLVFKGKKNSAFVVHVNFDKSDLTGNPVSSRIDLKDGDLYFTGDDYYNHPAQSGYYYSRGNTYKLLIASDIGMTLKRAQDGLHVYAMNVVSARPALGLPLSLYSYQNQVKQTVTTNTDGYAFFKTNDRRGYIYGQDPSGMALIRLNQPSWEMNSFDIGGQAGARDGIDAFIYTDRGVHRPGDTVHLAAFIRFKRKTPPKDQPVILTVKDPRGQTVLEKRTVSGNSGHVYFPIPTELDDPTGNWQALLAIGGQQFSKVLKIETVKPNRLKVNVEIPKKLEKHSTTLTGTISSKYLFGAPAANLKAFVEAILVHKDIVSEKFDDYTFNSPLIWFDQQYRTVLDGNLNNQGTREFAYPFKDLHNANGLVRVSLNARVFEKGGSFTESYKNTIMDPYGAYAGLQNVFQYNSARFGEKYDIPIVAVDADGNALAGHKLRVECFVNREHWWWHYDRHDRQSYMNSEYTFRISDNMYTSKDGPVTHSLSIEDYGSHFIQVTDVETGHKAGFFFYASRWGGRAVADESDERNILQIRTDKNIYNVGDRAELSIETPDKGIAVLTLEQGNRILHHEWKQINSNLTTFTLDLDLEMVPNVYASIYIVQPQNQKNNDLPNRLYGVKTLFIEDEDTRLPLFLTTPEKLEPKQEFTVQVRSLAKKQSSFTLAVVDEGLLDLTAFDTPSPWKYFFQKIRLAVMTMDNFDEIIGMLLPDMDKYLAIGGGIMDEEQQKRLDRSQVQRFKPVVLYQEPVTINPGQSKDITFTMPNYVGSVRFMLIGASDNSYVCQEKTVPVKLPVMVLPDAPRVARPGDEFDLPVTVFAMEEGVKQVKVTLQTSSNLQPDTALAILSFSKIGDQVINYRIKVGNRIGGDTLTVVAKSGDHQADYTVTLPIVSANPYMTEVQDTLLVKGETLKLVPIAFGLAGTNEAKLVFSKMPNLNIDERIRYLIRYPYGCLEQTVSSVFPQLFLPELIELKDYQKERTTENINSAIRRLTTFRLHDGFSYWPNSSSDRRYDYNDWTTSYAGHFMIIAKEMGYHVPDNLYNHWLAHARKYAKKVNQRNHRYQSYRLFTLALAGKPEMGAMNLLRENHLNDLDPLSRKLLAASYYLAGQKEAAVQIDNAEWEISSYRELGGTYGSSIRDRAMMAYLYLQMDDMKSAGMIMTKLVSEHRSGRWYSTQETSMMLLAAGKIYGSKSGSGGAAKFRVKIGNEKETKFELSRTQHVVELENAWNKEISITTDNSEPLYVSLQTEGIPLEDRVETGSKGISMARSFYNDEGYPINVSELEQGKAFWVLYKVQSTYAGHLEELALTSIFPAGWEIFNPRMTEGDVPEWVRKNKPSTGEYMDVRDDRINWFFDLSPNRSITFMARLSPTFRGEFRLPPVSVEAMYSPEYYARMSGTDTVVR